MAVDIMVRDSVKLPSVDRDRLQAFLEKLIKGVGRDINSTEVSVLLTDDHEIMALNKEYRFEAKKTDVLSFSMQEGGNLGIHAGMLGDVVVSMCTAQCQADKRGWSLENEVKFLALHGFLHLLGHDHANAVESQKMENRSQELWTLANENISLPKNFLSLG